MYVVFFFFNVIYFEYGDMYTIKGNNIVSVGCFLLLGVYVTVHVRPMPIVHRSI